ncbi:MAG: AbrB/MazE/SpoVT family DNA-binding domain-containing protein [Nitrososphaeraceae archaeon]|jgi:AbrB family looped-hinge helix DNA binding protein
MSDNTGAPDDTADAFKKAVEKGSEVQRDFIKYFSSVQHDAMQNFFSMLQGMTHYNAMFKTTVQTGGRISIPEAERQALNIEEGDLVQVILIPIDRGRKSSNETK